MKIRNILLWSAAFVAMLPGCKKTEENLGTPSVTLDVKELSFEAAAESKTVTLTATRDWTATCGADWIVVVPESGKASADPQTITVSVLENKELDRTAKVEFSIGMSSTALTVSQKGEKGSADDLIVYFNDFDKEQAVETDEKWPFLDQTEIWKNETGTGASAVEYASSGVSVRSNSTSDSKYSDYEGSGMNNLLFSSNNYFQIKGIALGTETNYKISFGTERYAYGADDNTFVNSEFHVYISNDAQKWVELEYAFPNGPKNGRWDLASSVFTLPSGTSQLCIYVKSDLSGAHRLDDLKLEISSETGGAQIDFSKGVDLGGGTSTPETIIDVTVAEFNAAAVSTDVWYRLKGTVVNLINTNYGNFDLVDETGTVYVYGTSNFSDFDVVEGCNIVIVGQRGEYHGKIEVLEGYIEEVTAGSSETVKGSIKDILNAKEGANVETEGVVAALYNRGLVITDGADNLLVYNANSGNVPPSFVVGDKISVAGTRSSYTDLPQISTTYDKLTKISGGNDVVYPSPEIVDASTIPSFDASSCRYIQFSGTLVKSGSYYNVEIAGATVKGSLSYPLESLNADSYVGRNVICKGYFAGGAISSFINMMAVSIERADSGPFFSVTPLEINVESDATSAKITVSSNVSWTAESSNPDFVLDKTSGTGDAEINVTFSANETEEARTADITISTTENVSDKSYTARITQKAKAAPLDKPFTSNIEWTLGEKSYSDKVIIDGTEYDALKLGTSSAVGSATIKIPAGTKRVGFYGVAWNGKNGTVVVKLGDTQVMSQDLIPNAGANNNSPYTLTVTSEDYYEMALPVTLPEDVDVTVSTVSGKTRVVLFGLNAYSE